MTTIFSLDPAAERAVSDTGYCFGKFTDNTEFEVIDSGVIHGGFNGFSEALHKPKKNNYTINRNLVRADIIICERYVVYNRAADPSPMLIEGVVRYLRPDAILQPSSGKNTLVPDSFLKAQGLWGTKGSGAGHHRDEVEAIRHAYVYLVKSLHKPTLLQLGT